MSTVAAVKVRRESTVAGTALYRAERLAPVPRVTNYLNAPSGADLLAFQAAERTAEFFDHLRTHYREARRSCVSIPVFLRIILGTGELYDEGQGLIQNLSPSGALLKEVKTTRGTYPAGEFRLQLRFLGAEHEGIGAEAEPVRFDFTASPGLGVRFLEMHVQA